MGETISAPSVNNIESASQTDHKPDQRYRRTKKRNPKPPTRHIKLSKMKKLSRTPSHNAKNKMKRMKTRRKTPDGKDGERVNPGQEEGTGRVSHYASTSSVLDQSDSMTGHDVRKIDTADALHLMKQGTQSKFNNRSFGEGNRYAECASLESLSQNPFFNYLKELRKKYAGMSVQDLAKKGGRNWRSMTQEEKFPYIVMARRYREYRLKRLQQKRSRSSENDEKSGIESNTKVTSRDSHKSTSNKTKPNNKYQPYVS